MTRAAGFWKMSTALAVAGIAALATLPAAAETDPKAVALKLDAIAFEGSDSLDAPDKVFQ